MIAGLFGRDAADDVSSVPIFTVRFSLPAKKVGWDSVPTRPIGRDRVPTYCRPNPDRLAQDFTDKGLPSRNDGQDES